MSVKPHRAKAQHFDVLIVGAGISGVGAAYHLTLQAPDRTFVVLEAKESFGGTWLTHTYPGIRSDSDLYTFGYRFKPWTAAPIAAAEAIRRYMGEVIEEAALGRHIRYGHRIEKASWSSDQKLWTVEACRNDTGERVCFTAGFLWMCQGYYSHEKGHTPQWPGMTDYNGRIVHPQTWPNDLKLAGKRVVVIGSRATAATLIPNIADDCAHVTMLQRSPTYFAYGRNANDLADTLRELDIEESWIHEIVRRQILHFEAQLTRRSFEEPDAVRQELLGEVSALLGPEMVEKHFSPSYRPWRQRLAFVPDADLFRAMQAGKASVETDEIERVTEKGLLLKSGKKLDADVIITATGFNLSVMGEVKFAVDGEPIDFAESVTYRGMMFTGVSNMVWVFGYLRSS
jgi:cation diffusion facilitator CzcD-associated flavoprotein CzcO